MIGRIRGILIEKHPPYLLLDVHGVGYEIEAPMSTFYNLPENNNELSLYTHLIVREDAHLLYGFSTDGERHLFRDLLKVNGVGAKLALTILSGGEPAELVDCIHRGDTARLTRLPGVGKKTAERLIVEMRDRLADWKAVATCNPATPTEDSAKVKPDAVTDAIAGLIALGYKPEEASRNVHTRATDGLSAEEIIRQVLKAAVRG
jgi:Holliday junction DNA helicase RuvA